jgi:hypothetical protein
MLVTLSACGPTEADIQEAIEQTQSAYTPTQSFTETPQATRTPKPTNTPRPTQTPIIGSFAHPLHVGDSIILPIIPIEYRKDENYNGGEIEFKLLEARSGDQAISEAKLQLDQFSYKEPISGQEYIAIKGFLKIHSYADNNQVKVLYPYWNLTLRSSDGGTDIWSVDPIYSVAEGYPPIEGEFWIFFLVREDSDQYLYFQPELIAMEQSGVRTSGVYFEFFEK